MHKSDLACLPLPLLLINYFFYKPVSIIKPKHWSLRPEFQSLALCSRPWPLNAWIGQCIVTDAHDGNVNKNPHDDFTYL